MRLNLTTRIFLGYAIVLLTFGVVSLFAINELGHNQQEIRLVGEGYLPLSETATAMEAFHRNQPINNFFQDDGLSLQRFIQLELPTQIRRISDAQNIVSRMVTSAEASEVRPIREVADNLGEIHQQYRQYENVALVLLHALSEKVAEAAELDSLQKALRQSDDQLGVSISRLRAILDDHIRQTVASAQTRERRTGTLIVALSALALLVGVLMTLISAQALRPIQTLLRGVARIREGDFSTQVGIAGEHEIARLSREFDAMAVALQLRENQLVEKQNQLLNSERLAVIGRTSAQIAHEIRNPLSSIGLNVDLLSDFLKKDGALSLPEKREADELVTSVTGEVRRLEAITENYLKMVRTPIPHFATHDLVKVIHSVMGFLAEELRRGQISVVWQAPSTAINAQVDDGQIRQVLLNLVRNAHEAMSANGTLTVDIKKDSDKIFISVTDTGPGMRPEVVARLFEPLFTTKHGGTGLGLSVSKQVATLHSGDLQCHTSAQGTTFTLVLPA